MPVGAARRGGGGFFGRRHGKTIRPYQAAALAGELAHYALDLSGPAPQRLADLFDEQVESIRIEIGFGGGEHLLARADEAPATGFIGAEPFVNGMAKLMARLKEQPRSNLRTFGDDATKLLDWLPSGAVDGIDLLYPDPWPKRRHWKRRFVSRQNLDRLARVLKPGGTFRFASDIDGYVNWTLLACRAHPAFIWPAVDGDDWHRPYPGWPGTRYEAKAIAAGRRPAYLTFRRL